MSSILKLGQIVSQGNPDINGKPQTVYYLEDMYKNVLIVSIGSYPLNIEAEVIDWVDANEMAIHGKINAFHIENIVINSEVSNIRQEVYNQLIVKYPSLVI